MSKIEALYILACNVNFRYTCLVGGYMGANYNGK